MFAVLCRVRLHEGFESRLRTLATSLALTTCLNCAPATSQSSSTAVASSNSGDVPSAGPTTATELAGLEGSIEPSTAAVSAELSLASREELALRRARRLERAREALVGLTGQPGKLVVLGTDASTGESVLLPEKRPIAIEPLEGTPLSIAALELVRLGDRVLTREGRVIRMWGRADKKVELSHDLRSLKALGPSSAYAITTGANDTTVFDAETGAIVYSGESSGVFHVTNAGRPARTQRVDQDLVRQQDLGSGATLGEWRDFRTFDSRGGHLLIDSLVHEPTGKSFVDLSMIALADRSTVAKVRVPFDIDLRSSLVDELRPDGKALASLDHTGTIRELDLVTGRSRVLGRLSGQGLVTTVSYLVYTTDGRVCTGTSGAVFPLAPGGAAERCHLSWPGAIAVRYPRPREGMRYVDPLRVQASIPVDPGTLEALSPDGTLLAVIVHDGNPVGTAPQRLDLVVIDTRDSSLLWQKALSIDRGPSTPPALRFSPDSRSIFVDGVGFDARSGGDSPLEAEVLERLGWALKNLGIAPELAEASVSERVPELPERGIYARMSMDGQPISVLVDLHTTLMRVSHRDLRRTVVAAPTKTGMAIFHEDGRTSVRGEGEGIHCAFGPVLAPHALCAPINEREASERGFPAD